MASPIPLDSAMNEEVNFCSQCGAKISSGVKFCSNCGHDLINSSTKITSDKTIKVEVTNAKVEVTNATVEKGFEAIGKVFKRNKKKREEKERQKREEKIRVEAILKKGTKMNEDRLTIVYIIAMLFFAFFIIMSIIK